MPRSAARNIAAFLPPAPPAPGGTPAATASRRSGATLAAPAATLPATVTRKALGSGLNLKVTVSEAGKVTLTATVPAKAMGRKGKPVTIGTGSATAKGAGTVTVKLKLDRRRPQAPEEAQGHQADADASFRTAVRPRRRSSCAERVRRRPRVSFCRVKERIDDLARQITELREAYYDGETRSPTPSTTCSRTSCGRAGRASGPHARPEPARAGRRAVRAARAGAPLAADAVAGEGDQARAGRGVLRSFPRPAGGRDAQARRASRWRSSTRTGGSRGRSRAGTERRATT